MRPSASSRRFTFISLLLFCFFVLAGCAAQIFAQTNDGKIMVPVFNDDGPATIHYVTPENSKAIGINSSGVPAMLPVGGSSTLAGLSDVAISGLANLDVLRYNSATAKWQNIPGSTFALASSLSDYLTSATAASTYAPLAHNQAWSTITSTPTTLAGYGISDAITSAAATDAFQPLDDDLTSIAALATTSTGRSLLAAADAAALRSILSVSDIGVHTFSSQRQILTSPTSSGTSPTSSSISTVLDYLTGSALAAPNGSLIFRGVGGWGLRSIGTNGQVLTSNGTQPVWSDPASSGITINSTTANGTAGHVLYTDGSKVQAYATTGSGDVVRGTSPTITGLLPSAITGTAAILGANTFTGAQSFSAGATYASAITPTNGTAWITTRAFFQALDTASGTANRVLIGENYGVSISSSMALNFPPGDASLSPDFSLSWIASKVLGLNGAAFEIGEMTAPGAPASNKARIYAEDNGSGKTRLMVIFGSGAAQQIAIEP